MDVRALIAAGEGERIEAKRAMGGLPESLWETYSAFANTGGGVILLGVSERQGSLFATGLPGAQKLARKIRAMAERPEVASCNLLAHDSVRIHDVDGKQLITVEVPKAPRTLRPVYVGGDASAGTFIRVGEGDFRLTPDEVRFYFALKRT